MGRTLHDRTIDYKIKALTSSAGERVEGDAAATVDRHRIQFEKIESRQRKSSIRRTRIPADENDSRSLEVEN